MSKIKYRKIYKQAAQQGGWSSGGLDWETKWGDIYQKLIARLKGTETLLDIGTAEGKRFLRLASRIKSGVGIDVEPGMIRLARKNSRKNKNISFKVMSARKLKFPAATFDVVIARHAPVSFRESGRVLKPGGVLVTQQVHENDKRNLKRAFKRGQNYKVPANLLLNRYLKEAKSAGFKVVKKQVSDRPYYFKSASQLVKYLNNTATIGDFGKKGDNEILKKFILQNRKPKGIESNSARFLLELKKIA